MVKIILVVVYMDLQPYINFQLQWIGEVELMSNVNLPVTLCPSELPSTIYSNQGHIVLHCAPYLFPKVWRREYGPCAAVDGKRGNPRRRCYT
jgi:hypothetical protein